MIRASLTKRYGSREVLSAATLSVARGTVHALVGENGAGKSTLVKILAGVVRGDGGSLELSGTPVDLARWDRRAARAAGIGIVQQHGSFAGTLSVVENAVLGPGADAAGARRGPLLDLAPTARALESLGERIGLAVDPWVRADRLPLGAAQRAEIVTALHHGAKLLVLDEPTAVLTPVEVDGLLATLRRLSEQGTTIVFVTHKLDEVRAAATAVTVLRAGRTVETFAPALGAPYRELDIKAVARAMVGADLEAPVRVPAPPADARIALELEHVSVGDVLHDIDLRVRAGEIVGIAGVDGNGQRELALAIAGLVPHGGRVRIGEYDVSAAPVSRRLAAGLAYVPEDRLHGGLVLEASVADNLTLGRRDITGRFRVDRVAVAGFAAECIRELDIRPADPGAFASTLSGGNQQKIVIGRELTRPQLVAILAAQPTRGVDLGAVARIHDRVRGAVRAGAGALVISADLDELLALCHRIFVLLRGRIVGTAEARAALGALMTGATR
jgi:simple sugar transport system ATP-binding protein